jgi:hypothetical protein
VWLITMMRNRGNQRWASSCRGFGQARRLRPVRSVEKLDGAPSGLSGLDALAQKDVGRTFARDVLRTFVAQSTRIDVVQEMLPRTE